MTAIPVHLVMAPHVGAIILILCALMLICGALIPLAYALWGLVLIYIEMAKVMLLLPIQLLWATACWLWPSECRAEVVRRKEPPMTR